MGMLHMDVIRERIERESGLPYHSNSSHVTYEVAKSNGETIMVETPSDLPDPSEIDEIQRTHRFV